MQELAVGFTAGLIPDKSRALSLFCPLTQGSLSLLTGEHRCVQLTTRLTYEQYGG